MPIQKISWDEVIKSSTVFYNNKVFEARFEQFLQEKIKDIKSANIGARIPTKEDIVEFIIQQPDPLKRIIGILGLPQEKFLRIVSALRRLHNDFGPEWSMEKVTKLVKSDPHSDLSDEIIEAFLNGYSDPKLEDAFPDYYRDRLHLLTLNEFQDEETLRAQLKNQYAPNYSDMKGEFIENLIRQQVLEAGTLYEAGRFSYCDVTADIIIPSRENPCIIIMSSYQETTASNQTTKARDMLACYQNIVRHNVNKNKHIIFINFADGGGWLARRSDLRKLYEGCHYFLNIEYLPHLKTIIQESACLSPNDFVKKPKQLPTKVASTEILQ